MTTAEAMAIAVLKGDMVAARALADHLCETEVNREKQLLPVKTFKVESNDIRVIAFVEPSLVNDVRLNEAGLRHSFKRWLSGEDRTLALTGFSHVELYEFPKTDVKVNNTKS